ncbi:peptidase inhibitor family I36 protein [Streptomyces sp. NPDC050423]|uniref:peptidase inhibitor family I36 protein n=1 Tax=Streptomyces sp. NPDC050423 TaxID=3155402 RepID=UPI0034253BF1
MRLTRVLPLVAAAVAAVFLGPVAPAQAATADCPSGYLCVWDQTSYNGHMYKFSGSNSDGCGSSEVKIVQAVSLNPAWWGWV